MPKVDETASTYRQAVKDEVTDGLWLLRSLAAAAPDPESDVVFLPQPRAVNLMKACQQWIASDEDLEEDVQSEMTLVFMALVPILSSVPGGHWDLMFDVIENNLEVSATCIEYTYTRQGMTPLCSEFFARRFINICDPGEDPSSLFGDRGLCKVE